jgi:hypothetical protein
MRPVRFALLLLVLLVPALAGCGSGPGRGLLSGPIVTPVAIAPPPVVGVDAIA